MTYPGRNRAKLDGCENIPILSFCLIICIFIFLILELKLKLLYLDFFAGACNGLWEGHREKPL